MKKNVKLILFGIVVVGVLLILLNPVGVAWKPFVLGGFPTNEKYHGKPIPCDESIHDNCKDINVERIPLGDSSHTYRTESMTCEDRLGTVLYDEALPYYGWGVRNMCNIEQDFPNGKCYCNGEWLVTQYNEHAPVINGDVYANYTDIDGGTGRPILIERFSTHHWNESDFIMVTFSDSGIVQWVREIEQPNNNNNDNDEFTQPVENNNNPDRAMDKTVHIYNIEPNTTSFARGTAPEVYVRFINMPQRANLKIEGQYVAKGTSYYDDVYEGTLPLNAFFGRDANLVNNCYPEDYVQTIEIQNLGVNDDRTYIMNPPIPTPSSVNARGESNYNADGEYMLLFTAFEKCTTATFDSAPEGHALLFVTVVDGNSASDDEPVISERTNQTIIVKTTIIERVIEINNYEDYKMAQNLIYGLYGLIGVVILVIIGTAVLRRKKK